MGKPDALSRQPDHGSGAEDNKDLVLLKPELFAVRATEGLQLIGEEADILKDIRRGRHGAHHGTACVVAHSHSARAHGDYAAAAVPRPGLSPVLWAGAGGT